MRCGKKKENERKKSPESDASFIAVTLLVGNKTASAAFAAPASQKGFGFFSAEYLRGNNRKKKDGILFSPSGGDVKFVTYINDTRKLNMSDV